MAVVLILSAAAAGGVGVATAIGGTAGTVAEQSIQTRTTKGKDAARRGQSGEAWRRMGLSELKRTVRQDLDCAAHSFGQVREFFLHTPCRSLHRSLLVLADVQRNSLVVSIAWVQMSTVDAAERLKALDDAFGTGSVSPISGALLGLGEIRFTGQHYASRRAGTLVVIAEATPGSGRPSVEALDAVADVAVELPPP